MYIKLSQLPPVTFVKSTDWCEVSRYSGGAPYTSSKASMAQISDFVLSNEIIKRGEVLPEFFTGNPKEIKIFFPQSYENISYTISVIGEDSRIWTVYNKTTSSFDISSNSNIPLSGSVYWRTEKI